jgi:hypothetical protein
VSVIPDVTRLTASINLSASDVSLVVWVVIDGLSDASFARRMTFDSLYFDRGPDFVDVTLGLALTITNVNSKKVLQFCA